MADNETSAKRVRKLLDEPFWIPTVSAENSYSRLHDDHDGTREGRLIISFGHDGDAWVCTDKHVGPPLRFRNAFGGGRSLRVRTALMMLAEAIRLDEEESPDL